MELYVHIPFCRKKCRYCAFVSFPGREADYEKTVDLILREARLRRGEASEPFSSVYIGGGTPSLLPPALFSRLLRGLNDIFDLSAVAEFTSEANPGTVTAPWLDAAAAGGVNRLSLGMQAGQERLLRLLGRIHTVEQVGESVSLARRAGIMNMNLDLIFGVPTQTLRDWEETLDLALSLDPCHISAYGLIPEEGTPLFEDLERESLLLPDPDLEREMYTAAKRKAAARGLYPYEVSNFAKKGYECAHNLGYWTQVPYIGLGVSAASMTDVHLDQNGFSYARSVNPDTLEAYEQSLRNQRADISPERISPADARFETVMLGLRLYRGVNEADFLRMHGVSLSSCYGEKMRALEKQGLLIHDRGFWKLTDRGFDIQNSVLVELLDS